MIEIEWNRKIVFIFNKRIESDTEKTDHQISVTIIVLRTLSESRKDHQSSER